MPTQKPMAFWPSLRRLVSFLAPERLRVTASLLLAVGSVALAVTGPRLLGEATNVVFNGFIGAQFPSGPTKAEVIAELHDRGQGAAADAIAAINFVPGQGIDNHRLLTFLGIALVVYVTAAFFGWVQGRITTTLVQRTARTLRLQVEAKLHQLPLSYVDKHQRGEVLSRITNDVDNVQQTLQQTLAQLVTSVLTILGVLGMMLWMSPLLALVAIITVPISAMVTAAIAKRSQPQFIEQWAATGRLNGHIEEMYSGHELVTAFGHRGAARQTFDEHNAAMSDAGYRANFASGTIQPSLGFLSNLNFVILAVVGGLRVASGALSLGELQAFLQYSRQFSQPLGQVASMMNLLQSGVASAERVFELLDAEEQEPEQAAPAVLPRPTRGRVAFEDVSFSYTDEPLIEHLSFAVEPGQTVAIVGPTGAGKTTLVNLLMRFYEVGGGRITLDGVDIRTVTRDDLRSTMGMVLQDTWLFGGTIADNLRYGAAEGVEVDEETLLTAARATHVDSFVRTLPDGYDTVLDGDATSVSAGERQLLTIARAFIADPAILILDEATSSVDTRTELLVQQAMAALRQGRTSFVIAHRLSTIRDADVILVMDKGAIVESGTHHDLLAADGAYAALYQSQWAAAVESEA